MRKLALIPFALAGFALAGVATAHQGARSVSPAAASFTATADTISTQSCTDAAGHVWKSIHGTYAGTATGDAQLTGKASVRLEATLDTTSNAGWAGGSLTVKDAASGETKAKAKFTAVLTATTLQGLLNGDVKGQDGGLLANVGGTLSADGKTVTGSFGGSSSGPNSAVYVSRGGGCKAKDDGEHHNTTTTGATTTTSEHHKTTTTTTTAATTTTGATTTTTSEHSDKKRK